MVLVEVGRGGRQGIDTKGIEIGRGIVEVNNGELLYFLLLFRRTP